MKHRPELVRSVPLLDFEIERGGDGRTVVAYAATFDTPYEVVDFDGHYDETINRSAFNRVLGRAQPVQVLYNHGKTLSGTPSSQFSLPIAVPIEIKPEGKGLLTRSRYLNTPLADEVLEMWRSDAIRAQSFRGQIFRSALPRPGANGRPLIERMELGLIEYGPAPFALNADADLVAIRSTLIEDRLESLGDLTPEERADLARRLTLPGPLDDPAEAAPVDEATEKTDPQEDEPEAAPVDPGSSIDIQAAVAANRRRRT